VNAGSDTTAIAMNNALYQLLRHPSCLTTLRAELDSVLSPTEAIAPYDKVRHLPYLRACLDESLRILPPTTFGLPRRTPAPGASIMGEFIPGDTSVSMSAYIAHRDERVFPEAKSYVPERWLGDRGKELQGAFIAFSTGARGCIGRNISYLEQTVLLASVVHRYGFALPHEGWEPERWEAMNLMPGPMPLKVWRRFPDEGGA
jgi:cytochrome P450